MSFPLRRSSSTCVNEAGSRPLRLPALPPAAKDRVAERCAPRLLGRTEHRVLRARAAEESDARFVAAPGTRRARVFLSGLRQPLGLPAHDGCDGPLWRTRQ